MVGLERLAVLVSEFFGDDRDDVDQLPHAAAAEREELNQPDTNVARIEPVQTEEEKERSSPRQHHRQEPTLLSDLYLLRHRMPPCPRSDHRTGKVGSAC